MPRPSSDAPTTISGRARNAAHTAAATVTATTTATTAPEIPQAPGGQGHGEEPADDLAQPDDGTEVGGGEGGRRDDGHDRTGRAGDDREGPARETTDRPLPR